jgi:hypothetical protein
MRFLPSLGLVLALTPASLLAQLGTNQNVSATLTGYQVTPAVSTDAIGTFRGTLSLSATSAEIRYTLRYSNLAIPHSTTAIHIHFAQENVNGGILIYLCDNAAGGGVPTCPTNGRLSGTITPADLQTINQNVASDDFDKFLRAMFAGKLYIDVHTTRLPNGEIRGQIKAEAFE